MAQWMKRSKQIIVLIAMATQRQWHHYQDVLEFLDTLKENYELDKVY